METRLLLASQVGFNPFTDKTIEMVSVEATFHMYYIYIGAIVRQIKIPSKYYLNLKRQGSISNGASQC